MRISAYFDTYQIGACLIRLSKILSLIIRARLILMKSCLQFLNLLSAPQGIFQNLFTKMLNALSISSFFDSFAQRTEQNLN